MTILPDLTLEQHALNAGTYGKVAPWHPKVLSWRSFLQTVEQRVPSDQREKWSARLATDLAIPGRRRELIDYGMSLLGLPAIEWPEEDPGPAPSPDFLLIEQARFAGTYERIAMGTRVRGWKYLQDTVGKRLPPERHTEWLARVGTMNINTTVRERREIINYGLSLLGLPAVEWPEEHR